MLVSCSHLTNVKTLGDASAISRIHGDTCVVEAHTLVVEASHVEASILNEPSQVVLLSLKRRLALKPSNLVRLLLLLKVGYVHVRRCVDYFHSLCWLESFQ